MPFSLSKSQHKLSFLKQYLEKMDGEFAKTKRHSKEFITYFPCVYVSTKKCILNDLCKDKKSKH